MVYYPKRIQIRRRRNTMQCVKCVVKTVIFLFWASLYVVVMKLTIFKGSVNAPAKDWSAMSDNYSKWMFQGPVMSDEDTHSDSRDWLEPDNATIVDLERRATRVQNICSKRALYQQPINSREFFVDHAHNLVWCNIFKAASSSWLYKFNILAGYDKKFLARTRLSPLQLARKKFPRPNTDEVKEAINTPGVVSMLVVREPFVRLLSAYRDKLENVGPPYYRKLSRNIVTEHRQKTKKIYGPSTFGPTFYEFVEYLIDNYKKRGKPKPFDEHWAPYYQFCSPCAVNFSVIAKVETLSRDSAYVIRELGLGQVLGRRVIDKSNKSLRTVMNKSRDGKNTTALLKHYFSQIDLRMLNDLLNIYGVDFEMFGYNSTIYRHYVRK